MKDITSLREHQQLVIGLAVAFGAVFPELAAAWLPDLSANAIRKLLRRLVRAGLLHKYSWGASQKYFILSRRAIRLLELPPRRVGPLGWEGLLQVVGVTGACVEANLEKLTAAQFKEHFPDLIGRGVQASYYAITPEEALAWIVVDHGASSFALVRKIHKLVAQRYRLPGFRELIFGGGFSVVIALATPQKALETEGALKKDPPRHVAVRVVVVPILATLILQKGGKS